MLSHSHQWRSLDNWLGKRKFLYRFYQLTGRLSSHVIVLVFASNTPPSLFPFSHPNIVLLQIQR
jgi:hypothetical protein